MKWHSLAPAYFKEGLVEDKMESPTSLLNFKARSHIETQLNSTVELSWVSASLDM